MQTDDLAAQMVRELNKRAGYLFGVLGIIDLEAIARRYMEKLFTEDELKRALILYEKEDDAGALFRKNVIDKIRAERAGKEPPHDR